MLVRKANRQDPDLGLGLHCLSMPFWQTTSVRNFRTYTMVQKSFNFACDSSVEIASLIKILSAANHMLSATNHMLSAANLSGTLTLCMLGNFVFR